MRFCHVENSCVGRPTCSLSAKGRRRWTRATKYSWTEASDDQPDDQNCVFASLPTQSPGSYKNAKLCTTQAQNRSCNQRSPESYRGCHLQHALNLFEHKRRKVIIPSELVHCLRGAFSWLLLALHGGDDGTAACCSVHDTFESFIPIIIIV